MHPERMQTGETNRTRRHVAGGEDGRGQARAEIEATISQVLLSRPSNISSKHREKERQMEIDRQTVEYSEGIDR